MNKKENNENWDLYLNVWYYLDERLEQDKKLLHKISLEYNLEERIKILEEKYFSIELDKINRPNPL